MASKKRSLETVLEAVVRLYCLVACSTVLLFGYVILVLPVFYIKWVERRLQEVMQRMWAFLVLGIIGTAVDAKITVYLPPGADSKKSEQVRRLLSPGIEFPGTARTNDPSSASRRDIIICNHQLYMDWMYIWGLAGPIGRTGVIKVILKRSLCNIPVFGWGMKVLNFIFLRRNWTLDHLKFGRRLRRLLPGEMPFSLVVFPEGTTLSASSRTKSDSFAEQNGIYRPKHTIVPRVTGMQFALDTIGDHIEGIMDLTIAYTGTRPGEDPEITFTLESLFIDKSGPEKVHIHVDYIPIDEVPFRDPDSFTKWMYNRFEKKDRLMEHFYQEGRFPGNVRSRPIRVAPSYAKLGIFVWTIVATTIIYQTITSLIALIP